MTSQPGDGSEDQPSIGGGVIREDYWVEVDGQDSDNSGRNDRVHVEIARPEATERGVTYPVVVEPSPYYGGFNRVEPHPVKVDLWAPGDDSSETPTVHEKPDPIELDEDDLLEFTGVQDSDWIGPSAYEKEFRDEGYIWAYAASVGTEKSTGCLDTGGPRELNGLEAVVDWFNGRATAYTSAEGSTTVTADWTDGNTAMVGASYNGTLPNAMASRGVDGLKTIVPIVAISSWYDYYRMNGHTIAPGARQRLSFGGDADWLQQAVVADMEGCAHVTEKLREGQDRKTGDYNEFWRERDYVTDADNVEASVLVASGLSDYNVWVRNAARWIDALSEEDVPYKVWLHQGGHQDPLAMVNSDTWKSLISDWFAHWLKGAETGVMDGPTAYVQRDGKGGEFVTDEDWPVPSTEPATVEFTAGGSRRGRITLDSDTEGVEEQLVDDSQIEKDDPLLWESSVFNFVEKEESKHRLLYRTGPLEESVRLSGTPQATLRLAVEDNDAAIVSVALVDHGPVETEIVNFGWMNPHNRESLTESKPIEQGTFYDLAFPMQAVDHVFEPGHRIGIAVYSSDIHFTKRPPKNPTLTLSVGKSSVDLPVVGGKEALSAALPPAPDLQDGWQVDLGGREPLSTPAADQKRVYTTQNQQLTALSRADGSKQWTVELPAAQPNISEATVATETVYVCAGDTLYAFDQTGKKRWTYTVADGETITTRPLVNNGVFVVSSAGVVHAVDPETENRLWTTGIDSPVYGEIVADQKRLFVAGLDGRVHAIGMAEGSTRWTVDTGVSPGTGSPAVHDGTVYIAGDALHAIEAPTGDEQFRVSSYGGTAGSTPTVANGVVYVGDRDGLIHAVDAANGKKVWTHEASDSIAAKPALAAGKVYVPSVDGQIHILNAATGTDFGSATLPAETESSPARIDDEIYLTTRQGTVAAFSAVGGDS